jgi:poly(hydroxyalkanoate) depolymerase family esterase
MFFVLKALARRPGVRLAVVCSVVAALLVAGVEASAVTVTSQGKLAWARYTNRSGTLRYELYVPSTYRAGRSVPLVVALHGCTQTADAYRRLSGWDTLAEAKGFIVVFPQQSSSQNYFSCWNWFLPADMNRGSGEPSLIAGITSSVAHRYSVDRRRVYVAGFSAGGAMANVMGATYPDRFAAVGVGSGCEYNGLPCLGWPGPDPSQTGAEAYRAMGVYARVVPVIVFQGDADSIVAPANAPRIVREWQVTDNRVAARSIRTSPLATFVDRAPAGASYTLTTYGGPRGNEMIQYWLVHGMNHAWSGGSSSEQYADPSGPSETAAMYAFFSNHSARRGGATR